MATEGVLTKTGRGQYDLVQSVRAYIDHIRMQNMNVDDALKAAKLRQTEAAAEKLEIHNRRQLQELIPTVGVYRVWSQTCGVFRSAILRLGPTLGHRVAKLSDPILCEQELDDWSRELLNELSEPDLTDYDPDFVAEDPEAADEDDVNSARGPASSHSDRSGAGKVENK